jgi:aryl-alcohol dehydrogenase-like predicted oxidoreductase
MSKLVLGTANFGNTYGVANKGESLSSNDSRNILNWAQNNGINHFDTAIAYGDAEDLLGIHLDRALNPVVDAKLDKKSCQSSELIIRSTKDILRRLRLNQLSVLYLHSDALLGTALGPEIKRGLEAVLDLGLCKRIGVSVYSEETILISKKVVPKLSVFQVPENICDRRLYASHKIEELAFNGNSFCIRSVFLQGLLLMNLEEIPKKLNNAVSGIEQLRDFATKHSITRLELCISYAKSIPWVESIIVGVASLEQLQEIMKCQTELPTGWERVIPSLPRDILDPRKWEM